ncbi:hypothetical protein PIB30_093890 [Stylosanthes scabra]|uniref:Uncharacterized protein n=1 Tax=Stylosanthes scabra TaxID=79078 RepID=A0ABU6RVZ6_9FABA|nr:hypothetical protein [Stylosanthes scabra]
MAITPTSELRLTHRLRLREALFILYVSIPPLRFLSFQERSSLGMDQESSPMWLNEGAMNVVRSKRRSRKGDSKLEDALGAMGMRVGGWMLKWSGGTAYVCVELGIQGIDFNPSESTFLRSFLFQIFSKSFKSIQKGSKFDSFMDRGEIDLKTMQGVDSEVFKSTPPSKMSFNELCESTWGEPESIHMSPDF